jgi:hypothetical protein
MGCLHRFGPVLLTLAVGLLPASLRAQPSEADMRQMMEAMQGMQACMAGVDQAAISRFQQQAQAAEAEMRRLCRAGQQAAAEARALQLGLQMASDPTIKTMQACMARLPQLPMLQSASPLGQLTFDDEPIGGNARPLCERLD